MDENHLGQTLQEVFLKLCKNITSSHDSIEIINKELLEGSGTSNHVHAYVVDNTADTCDILFLFKGATTSK